MYIKKYMIKPFCTLYFQLKGIHLFAAIPILGLYLILPISHYIAYHFYQNMDMLYMNIINECQYLCPILSVWWIFFVLEHYVEEDGHELLYIGRRNKVVSLILLYILFLLLMIPLFVVYTSFFSDLWWLYAKLIIIQWLYMTILYCGSFLIGKINIPVIITLLYTICAIMGAGGISYYQPIVSSGIEFVQEMRGFLLAGILLMATGCICNHFFPEHNR